MTCRGCNDPVLDGKLLCPKCVAAQSHKAVLAAQKDFMPSAMQDQLDFRLMRQYGRKEWHVEMLAYKGQAFCGLVFEAQAKRRLWEAQKKKFSLLRMMEDLCVPCRETLSKESNAVAMEAR